MHCTLLVPDLFLPGNDAAHAARGLALRGLETALARARAEKHAPVSQEAWLCQAFEVERQQDWPVAPITLVVDGGDPGDRYWLRADPVNLQLQRDRVALMASDTLALTPEDAEAMVTMLNAQFGPDGLNFEARAPDRWYVSLPRAPALVTATMSAATGRNVQDVLPSGEDGSRWRRIMNEIQMLLHGLPVNAARESAGHPPVNSVWFWGGGRRTDVPGRTFSAVWSCDLLSQALGAQADAHAAPLPANARDWQSAVRTVQAAHHLVVVDACSRAAAYGDIGGWREAVLALEKDWIAPLLDRLKTGEVAGLAIAAPCADASWRFELTRRSLYKLWARPRPLASYSGT